MKIEAEEANTLIERELVVLQKALEVQKEANKKLFLQLEDEKLSHETTKRNLINAQEEIKILKAEIGERKKDPFFSVIENITLKESLEKMEREKLGQRQLELQHQKESTIEKEMKNRNPLEKGNGHHSKTQGDTFISLVREKIGTLQDLLQAQENKFSNCEQLILLSKNTSVVRAKAIGIREVQLSSQLESMERELKSPQTTPEKSLRIQKNMELIQQELIQILKQKAQLLEEKKKVDEKLKLAKRLILKNNVKDSKGQTSPQLSTLIENATKLGDLIIITHQGCFQTSFHEIVSSIQRHGTQKGIEKIITKSDPDLILEVSTNSKKKKKESSKKSTTSNHHVVEEEEEELPNGWEKSMDNRGVVYYVDHINRQTYWTLPDSILSQMKSNKEKKGSLTKMNGYSQRRIFKEISNLSKSQEELASILSSLVFERISVREILTGIESLLEIAGEFLQKDEKGMFFNSSPDLKSMTSELVHLRCELSQQKVMLKDSIATSKNARERYVASLQYLREYHENRLKLESERVAEYLNSIEKDQLGFGKIVANNNFLQFQIELLQSMLSESQQSEQSQSYITALEKNLESAKNSIRFFGETLDKVSKEKSELEKRLIETQHALRTIDSDDEDRKELTISPKRSGFEKEIKKVLEMNTLKAISEDRRGHKKKQKEKQKQKQKQKSQPNEPLENQSVVSKPTQKTKKVKQPKSKQEQPPTLQVNGTQSFSEQIEDLKSHIKRVELESELTESEDLDEIEAAFGDDAEEGEESDSDGHIIVAENSTQTSSQNWLGWLI